MKVKELIELLQQQNQDALVYTMAHDDDVAVIATNVWKDVLTGTDKTIVIVY